MDQCRKVREQLMDQWGKQGNSGLGEPVGANDFTRHLAGCASCRSFQQNLPMIGKNLDDLGAWADDGTSVPELAYFEKLVGDETINNPVQSGNVLGRRLCIREVLAFIALGVLILSGAGVTVYHGYLWPVEIVFGLTAMHTPLLILLREPEYERGGWANEA